MKTLTFADAIKFMTENPGKEVKNSENYTYRYYLDKYWRLHREDKFWQTISGFDLDDVSGQWTISEPELPEVEFETYVDNSGQVYFAKQGSHDANYFQKDERYTKCKIKFNQGND